MEEDFTNKLHALGIETFALDNVNEGVVITDMTAPDQPIVYVNKAFTDITEYPREEILGKNCRFLQGKLNNQPELELLRKTLKDHTKCKITLMNFKKSGELFYNELSLAPIKNSSGEVTHFIGIQKDITELTQSLMQLKKLNEIFVGRELKMTEMKAKIRKLENRIAELNKEK